MSHPYGWEHKRRREALLPLAYGKVCPLCSQMMQHGEALDLDHSTPVAQGGNRPGDRMAHASCNRARGAAMGNRMRAGKRNSRDW